MHTQVCLLGDSDPDKLTVKIICHILGWYRKSGPQPCPGLTCLWPCFFPTTVTLEVPNLLVKVVMEKTLNHTR